MSTCNCNYCAFALGERHQLQLESWTGDGAARARTRTSCVTGTTCRAASLACSDWSEERDVGRSGVDRVEGGGDYGELGRQPRCAVAGVLTKFAVEAPDKHLGIYYRAVSRSPYIRDSGTIAISDTVLHYGLHDYI
jgi:hypothetical protein